MWRVGLGVLEYLCRTSALFQPRNDEPMRPQSEICATWRKMALVCLKQWQTSLRGKFIGVLSWNAMITVIDVVNILWPIGHQWLALNPASFSVMCEFEPSCVSCSSSNGVLFDCYLPTLDYPLASLFSFVRRTVGAISCNPKWNVLPCIPMYNIMSSLEHDYRRYGIKIWNTCPNCCCLDFTRKLWLRVSGVISNPHQHSYN